MEAARLSLYISVLDMTASLHAVFHTVLYNYSYIAHTFINIFVVQGGLRCKV